MLGALLYLRLTSFKNWLLQSLRSLRQPKKLVATIVGVLYIWFFFIHRFGGGRPRASRHAAEQATRAMEAAGAALPEHWLPAAMAFGALALLVFVALMWIVPTQRAALGFTEAEIAFLFPAPITRRALVHFRLLSGQLRSLIGATVMTMISNRWSFLGGTAFTHALGWWFVFSALNLHYSGANFTLTRLADAGLGAWRRRTLVLLFVTTVIGVTIWRLPAEARLPVADDASVIRPFTDWIVNVTSAAPLGWLLWPFKFVIGPFVAPDFRAFLLALAPALLVIGIHYLWVVRAAVAFEDSSIDYAQKRSARVAAWRSGQRRFGGAPAKARAGPFALAGTGRPEFAFLWKNLLSTWPYFTPRVFAICAFVIALACTWLGRQSGMRVMLAGAGGFAGVFALYMLIIGPQFARQDIRSDLANADILKTYPLPGWQIVLGELLAPVAILTGLLWLALLTFALAFRPTDAQPGLLWLTPQLQIAGAAWLALITPVLVTLQLLVPNAAALVFPAWFQATRTRGGGPEVAGQRMIFFFAQIVTMAIALLPAVGFAALLIFILTVKFNLDSALAVSIAAAPVLVVLVGEVWCGVWLLGQRFEKLDLSAELRA